MIFDTLENLEIYAPTVPCLASVAEAMDHDEIYDKEDGTYSTPNPNVTYKVQCCKTLHGTGLYEFHKHHTIVEIVLYGEELMSTSWRELKNTCQTYDKEKDVGFFKAQPLCVMQGSQGRFAVFLPGEAFCTSLSQDSDIKTIKKVVFTIKEE